MLLQIIYLPKTAPTQWPVKDNNLSWRNAKYDFFMALLWSKAHFFLSRLWITMHFMNGLHIKLHDETIYIIFSSPVCSRRVFANKIPNTPFLEITN